MRLDKQRRLLKLFKTGRYVCFKDGRIFSFIRGKFLTPSRNNSGYLTTCLRDRTSNLNVMVSVHQAIWVYFNFHIPKGYELHHKDHDKGNNSLYNLELVTRSENNRKAYQAGITKFDGEHAKRRVLTSSDVVRIRELHRKGHRNKDIALLFKVASSTISYVVNYKSWRNV